MTRKLLINAANVHVELLKPHISFFGPFASGT